MRLFRSRSKAESSRFIRCVEIVWEYKSILGEHASWKSGIPRSKLPYGIREIERALITIGLEHVDDPNILLVFEDDFAALAYFIDDKEALAYHRIQTADFRLGWLDYFVHDEGAPASKRTIYENEPDRDSAILWAASVRKGEELAKKWLKRKAVFVRAIRIFKAKTGS